MIQVSFLVITLTSDARALFERSALRIPADRARPLWDTWARYEYMFGDLNAVHKLEARFAETFPNGTCQDVRR
jgi:cleavage stimulation factor subunit 3